MISTCLGAAARSGTWSAAHASNSSGVTGTAGSEGDERDGHLAGVRVRPSDGGDGGHVRMLEQRMLDRRRVDVVAAADDQVLGATGEPDEPIRVNGSQVAGVEPAVLDLLVGAQLEARIALHEIAGEDVGAAQHERPDLALGQERPLAGRLVDGHRARLLVGQALPDRLRPAQRRAS